MGARSLGLKSGHGSRVAVLLMLLVSVPAQAQSYSDTLRAYCVAQDQAARECKHATEVATLALDAIAKAVVAVGVESADRGALNKIWRELSSELKLLPNAHECKPGPAGRCTMDDRDSTWYRDKMAACDRCNEYRSHGIGGSCKTEDCDTSAEWLAEWMDGLRSNRAVRVTELAKKALASVQSSLASATRKLDDDERQAAEDVARRTQNLRCIASADRTTCENECRYNRDAGACAVIEHMLATEKACSNRAQDCRRLCDETRYAAVCDSAARHEAPTPHINTKKENAQACKRRGAEDAGVECIDACSDGKKWACEKLAANDLATCKRKGMGWCEQACTHDLYKDTRSSRKACSQLVAAELPSCKQGDIGGCDRACAHGSKDACRRSSGLVAKADRAEAAAARARLASADAAAIAADRNARADHAELCRSRTTGACVAYATRVEHGDRSAAASPAEAAAIRERACSDRDAPSCLVLFDAAVKAGDRVVALQRFTAAFAADESVLGQTGTARSDRALWKAIMKFVCERPSAAERDGACAELAKIHIKDGEAVAALALVDRLCPSFDAGAACLDWLALVPHDPPSPAVLDKMLKVCEATGLVCDELFDGVRNRRSWAPRDRVLKVLRRRCEKVKAKLVIDPEACSNVYLLTKEP